MKDRPPAAYLYTQQLDSPYGPVGLVASGQGVVAVELEPDDADGDSETRTWLARMLPAAALVPEPNRFTEMAAAELAAYFRGEIRQFTVPVDLQGTPFQVRAWRAVAAIPYGTVMTYGEVAAQIRSGPRAVGNAMSRNPASILVPCHRVVAAGGLGGYGGRMYLKRRLLAAEGVKLK